MLSARYWSEAAREGDDGASIFYCWRGERPMDPDAPQLEGTGEIKLESVDCGAGYFITRASRDLSLNARTSGVYWRADSQDLGILDAPDQQKRAALIAERLQRWKSMAST